VQILLLNLDEFWHDLQGFAHDNSQTFKSCNEMRLFK
jgi:hypothetical protein